MLAQEVAVQALSQGQTDHKCHENGLDDTIEINVPMSSPRWCHPPYAAVPRTPHNGAAEVSELEGIALVGQTRALHLEIATSKSLPDRLAAAPTFVEHVAPAWLVCVEVTGRC